MKAREVISPLAFIFFFETVVLYLGNNRGGMTIKRESMRKFNGTVWPE